MEEVQKLMPIAENAEQVCSSILIAEKPLTAFQERQASYLTKYDELLFLTMSKTVG